MKIRTIIKNLFVQDVDNVTPEERKVRLKKADSIRKMLADTQAQPTAGPSKSPLNE